MPKQQPDNVHLLKGTYRKDRHGKLEEKPQVTETIAKTPPSWLPEKAKIEWERIIRVMLNSNVLTNADASTLLQYCCLFAEFQEELFEFPAAKHTQLRLCAVELGLTPSARSKIIIPGRGKDEQEF